MVTINFHDSKSNELVPEYYGYSFFHFNSNEFNDEKLEKCFF